MHTNQNILAPLGWKLLLVSGGGVCMCVCVCHQAEAEGFPHDERQVNKIGTVAGFFFLIYFF